MTPTIAHDQPAAAPPVDTTCGIVALAFSSQQRASDAMAAAQRLVDHDLLTLHDAVFVSRADDGTPSIVETADPAPVAAAIPASLFGALVGTLVAGPLGFLVGGVLAGGSGALAAKLVDTGISQDVIGQLQALTRPGQTVLALLVSNVAGMAAIEELRRFEGAHVVYATLPPLALEVVRQTLGDTH